MDRRRLLDAVEVARRVRSGSVTYGDATVLAEELLWLASHVLCVEDARSGDPRLESATREALVAEIHELRAALIESNRKTETLEQLLSLWQTAAR